MTTEELPVVAVQVHKITLLDPNSEPSDDALKSIMAAFQHSARAKSEQANRELYERLQRETKAARERFGAPSVAPAA